MTITFKNLPGVDKLVKLDAEFRKKALLVKHEKEEAVISTMIREDEFHYYSMVEPVARSVVFLSHDPEKIRFRIAWQGGAAVCKPMTYEEAKAELNALLAFLAGGDIPKLITDTPEYMKAFGAPF